MQNINNLIDEFGAYLILYRKKAVATFNAYKHDAQNFVNYLQDNEIELEFLTENDIKLYFRFLKSKKLSNSSAVRSIGALKLFAKFLNEKYGYQDYSSAVKISCKFPLICDDEDIKNIINNFERIYYNSTSSNINSSSEILAYQDLRNYLMIYLLYVTQININQLINLEVNNIDFDNKFLNLLRSASSTKIKKISLPLNFFDILKNYVKTIPYNTVYLFPTKLGNEIKPISKQAAWASIRLFLNKSKQNINIKTDSHNIDLESIDIYKKKHPRS